MKLILTRHGETNYNKQKILQGWKDTELNENGIQQAKNLALRLKDAKIDIIYTSDLKRASRTAEEISKFHDCPLIKDKRLREKNFGKLNGTPLKDVDWGKYEGTFISNRTPGGESFQDVKKRIKNFYEEIKEKHKLDSVLVVGHGGTAIIFITILLNKPLEEIENMKKLDNTAISEFEIKENVKTICMNCSKHNI